MSSRHGRLDNMAHVAVAYFSRHSLALIVITVVALVATGVIGVNLMRLHIRQLPFNSEAWKQNDDAWTSQDMPTARQTMIRDLIQNYLDGKNHLEIEELLGESWTHENTRIDQTQNWYYQEYDWDMLYPIGKELSFLRDSRGVFRLEPEDEYLVLRVGGDGRYLNWFIIGSSKWPELVGDPARRLYQRARYPSAAIEPSS